MALFSFYLLCLVSLFSDCFGAVWTGPETCYVFAPGILSSEHQIAKYCPYYRATTGQEVISTHGYELLQGQYAVGCNFAEIMFQGQVPLFGIVREKINNWALSILEKSNAYYQIVLSDSIDQLNTLKPYYIALWRLNFGQELDCYLLKKTITSVFKNTTNSGILFGVSRGAAAIVNCLGFFNKNIDCTCVKGIVLESCYDSIKALSPFSFLLELVFPFYRSHGFSPISAETLNSFAAICKQHHIKILLISSMADVRVPFANTERLARALAEEGLDVYLLKLERVGHSDYLSGDPDMANSYQSCVHAFYKLVGAAYIPELAFKGQQFLALSKVL